MSKSLEKLTVGRAHDRRIKMTPEDITEAVQLRKDDPFTWSYSKLARKFGVSKRLIIFRIKPETLEKVLEQRRERGGYHTPTKRQNQYMRTHRRYKRELRERGII